MAIKKKWGDGESLLKNKRSRIPNNSKKKEPPNDSFPKMYYHQSKGFHHFIDHRLRYWLGNSNLSIYAALLTIIVIIGQTSASVHDEKINANYKNNSNNNYGNWSEHNRRHSHKYYQPVDSLLKNLKNSRATAIDTDNDTSGMPRWPYDDLGEPGCPTCSYGRNTDQLRLEVIKKQILSKLGLKERPKISLPVPRDVIFETLTRADTETETEDKQEVGDKGSKTDDDLGDSEPDDFYGRTSKVITFAEPGQLLNGQTLLEFSYSSETDLGVIVSQIRVKSALLWVRVALNRSIMSHQIPAYKNMTLWVFRVKPSVANTSFISGKDFDEHTELVGYLSVSLNNLGWQKIDMTFAVREWYKEGSLYKEKLRLLVDCSGCKDIAHVLIFNRNKSQRGHNGFAGRKVRSADKKPGHKGRKPDEGPENHGKNVSSHSEKLDPNRPFLAIHTEPVVMKRTRRRAVDCSGAVRGQCCKESFFVSFEQLEWDDWIIAPKGYQANYCRGDCGGFYRTPDTYLNYHTHVLQEFSKVEHVEGLQPCCAPVKFSGISIIYFGPDNNIIKRELPKMVVEQCGCP